MTWSLAQTMNNLPQQGLIRMETIGGLEHVMKTGFKPSVRRACHGVQHVCTFRVIFYGLRYCAVLMQSHHSDESQPFHILHRSRSPHNAQHSTS